MVRKEFGAPDILVLNTGRPPSPMRAILDENEDDRWEDAYRTQLWGAILVARGLVPGMIERGHGRVIGVTSATVKQPMKHHGLSTVFRAGLTAYLKHLANEIAPTGITVNCVCPGSIDAPGRSEAENESRRSRVPLGRLGRAEELAAAVAFFASADAGFITGASLHVDGGMVGSLS